MIDAAGGAITINLDNAADCNLAGTIKAEGATQTVDDVTTTVPGAVTININVGGDVNDGTVEALEQRHRHDQLQ